MATNQATVNPPCPCYYSHTRIEGLGLHVVNITRYVITIKNYLHNRIKVIKIERQ